MEQWSAMQRYGDPAEAEIVSTTGRLETSCERLGHKLIDIYLQDIEEQIAHAVARPQLEVIPFSQRETAAAKYGVRIEHEDGSAIDIILVPREAS